VEEDLYYEENFEESDGAKEGGDDEATGSDRDPSDDTSDSETGSDVMQVAHDHDAFNANETQEDETTDESLKDSSFKEMGEAPFGFDDEADEDEEFAGDGGATADDSDQPGENDEDYDEQPVDDQDIDADTPLDSSETDASIEMDAASEPQRRQRSNDGSSGEDFDITNEEEPGEYGDEDDDFDDEDDDYDEEEVYEEPKIASLLGGGDEYGDEDESEEDYDPLKVRYALASQG